MTAFPTIVWHSVCLIIVSIPHTSQLPESYGRVGVVLPILCFSAPAVGLELTIFTMENAELTLESFVHMGMQIFHPIRQKNKAMAIWGRTLNRSSAKEKEGGVEEFLFSRFIDILGAVQRQVILLTE